MAYFWVLFYDEVAGDWVHVPGPEVSPNHLAWNGIDGTDATGLAAIATKFSGKFIAFPLGGAQYATLLTNIGVVNGEILYTAKNLGAVGNNIRVRYVAPGTANQALSVSVSGNDITVNLATNASSIVTTTGALAVAAINASSTASALVTAANGFNGTGAGVLTAMAFTNLIAGSDGLPLATNTSTVLQAESSPITIASL